MYEYWSLSIYPSVPPFLFYFEFCGYILFFDDFTLQCNKTSMLFSASVSKIYWNLLQHLRRIIFKCVYCLWRSKCWREFLSYPGYAPLNILKMVTNWIRSPLWIESLPLLNMNVLKSHKYCGLISNLHLQDSFFTQILFTLPNVNFTCFPSEFATECIILISVVRKYLNMFPSWLVANILHQILY